MTGWQKQASEPTMTSPTRGSALSLALLAAASMSEASASVASPPSMILASYSDPSMIWNILVGGFVIFGFLTCVILWVMTALRKLRRANTSRATFVSTALNNLSQGVVMVDARKRIVFCNDRYLEIYGLSRSDIFKGMTGRQLIELRAARGMLGPLDEAIDEYYKQVRSSEGYICELKDGRSIRIKNRDLTKGGGVSTHEDCTAQRNLAKQLATTKNFPESVIDNIPVCVAAKTIEDGRYILANRAFEQFSQLSREQIVGKTAEDLYTPSTARTITQADQATIASSEGQIRSEFSIERRGERRMLASNRVIARNEKNEPEYLVALFEDVTERRSAKEIS